MTHICVAKLTIIGSDNGLSPGRHKAIIWTNAVILLNWTIGNNLQWNFNGNSNILIQENAFENVAILSRLQCVNGPCEAARRKNNTERNTTSIVCRQNYWQPRGPFLNIKTVFTSMGISIIKIRWSWYRLIFIKGIPILVRLHLYTETGPRICTTLCALQSLLLLHLSFSPNCFNIWIHINMSFIHM